MFIIGKSTIADYSLDQNYQTAKYPITAYPDRQKDDTHFQPEGANAITQLAFDAMENFKR